MRPLRLLPVLMLAVAGLAVPAHAKDGVRAKLDKPVRLDAKPGERIRVAWHLVTRDGHNFGASGIYLRVSRCGRRMVRIRAMQVGDGYYARVTVPRGGIRKLTVGLEGWRITAKRRERADAIFAFAPRLQRRCS